jgi:hypothetical protein
MIDLLDESAAAEALRLQPKTVCRWRWERRGPAYVKLGGAVRYRRADLADFIARNRVAQDD